MGRQHILNDEGALKSRYFLIRQIRWTEIGTAVRVINNFISQRPYGANNNASALRPCWKKIAHQTTVPIPSGISSHQRAMNEGRRSSIYSPARMAVASRWTAADLIVADRASRSISECVAL